MRKKWTFRALDTFFFRDGTPFHQGEGGMVQPKGSFPPSIMTLQGAIRAGLARCQGWTPSHPERWPQELGTPDDLGDLRLAGPYLCYKGEYLFPAPLVLFGEKNEEWELTRLILGDPVDCDLGEQLRLPKLAKRIKGDLFQGWLTKRGMEQVLAGELPDQTEIYSSSQLWKEERRVGLERNCETRTAEDARLYAITHIRPQAKLEMVVFTEGIPQEWEVPTQLTIPLGGEGRVASASIVEAEERILPEMPPLPVDEEGILRFTVSLLTPGYYADPNHIILHGPEGVPGKCVSASIGKLQQIGGWDLKNRCPRPLYPLLPAGSTWFFEAPASELPAIQQLHGAMSGEKSLYGMGQLLIGTWNR